MLKCWLPFCSLLLSVLPVATAKGQDPYAAVREKQVQVITEMAHAHTVRTADGTCTFELAADPLTAWTSPTRGDVFGGTFLWTHNTRPMAYGGIYLWYNAEEIEVSREFHSLCEVPVIAEHLGNIDWAPQRGGIRYQPVPEAGSVADSALRRLRQLKAIATRFQVEISYPDVPPEEMRLLPTPIYRYADRSAGVLDGAVFAFSKGTDPEALLFLEAKRDADNVHWNYAFARSTVWRVVATLDGQQVFSVPGYDFVGTTYQDPFYVPSRSTLD